MNILLPKKIVVYIIFFILLIFTRICGIIFKTEIIHDEVISFISATVNQETYHLVEKNKTHPYGKVVPVSEWKKLWTLKSKFSMKKIQSDLVDYDLHPPLYFWSLHLFICIFGVHKWSGLLLNLFIEIMTAIILYRFTYRLFNSNVKAMISVILWGFLPSTIDTFISIRQYSLFVFFSLLLIYYVLLFINNEKNRIVISIILGCTICMGLLTFYYFVFIVFGCGIWILIKCRKNKKNKIVLAITILLCSLVVFYIIHPEFLKHLGKVSQIQGKKEGIKELFYRLGTILIFFCPHRFFLGIRSKSIIMFFLSGATIGLLIISISLLLIKRRLLLAYINKMENNKKYLVFILLWLFLYNILLYAGFFTPEHAITGRYLSIVNPFIVILLVMSCEKKKILNLMLIVIFTVGVISMLAESFFGIYLRGFMYDYYIKNTKFIILDNVKRGHLPRFLWYIPGNIHIIAAIEEDLINTLPDWQQNINSHSLFLSNNSDNLYNYLMKNAHFKPKLLDIKFSFSRKVYGFNNSW